MNSVASWMRLTSHKPQQKCIHCNCVPTDKFLTFDKTKYREIRIVNQMTENDEQNIISNKCHNTILKESLVTCLTCDKTMKKMLTLKFDMDKYSVLENKTQEMLNHTEQTLIYARAATYNSNQNVHVCVATQMCNVHKDICKMYNKVDYDFSRFVGITMLRDM